MLIIIDDSAEIKAQSKFKFSYYKFDTVLTLSEVQLIVISLSHKLNIVERTEDKN